jgi:hypothetical protein
MAGIDPEDSVPEGVLTDSVSFMPALSDPGRPSDRDWIFADYFGGGFAGVEGADYAMRNHRYKLLRTSGQEEFYDLQEDPYEQTDLLAGELTAGQKLEFQALAEQIATLRNSE